MTIRVFIADDHSVVRQGLRRILALAPEFSIVGEAANGEELLEGLSAAQAEVVLMDVSMPGTQAVDIIGSLKRRTPQLGVLMLSMHDEGPVAARMLQAGASGYLTKDCDPQALLAALRKVAFGGRYIHPSIAEKMIFSRDESRPLHESLSEREREVLRLIVAGTSLNDIAAALSISPKTVSTHKARLMEKLKVDSNAELIRYAVVSGLAQ